MLVAPWTARADVTPLSFTGYFANNNGNSQTLGYEFTPKVALTLTALSYFDNGGDGLLSAHTVGIWNASGTLLASTLVPIGTVATLQDGFRYVALAGPLTLTAGANYYVGGTSGGPVGLDPYAQDATGVTVGSAITYLASAQAPDIGPANPLTFPGTTGQTTPGAGFYGGSFLYVVPEPSTLGFLGVAGGSLALLALGRRRLARA